MKSAVLCVFLVISLPLVLEASPVNNVKRFLRSVAVSRVPRQSMDVCVDGNNTGCLPDGVTQAPDSVAQCVNRECVCMDCFLLDDDTGRCRTCSDYRSNTVGMCGIDRRPRQLTALLLSVFLSGVGAANFYIDQNGLAGGQLFLMIFLTAISYVMCCLPCCLACCMDDVKGSIFFIIVMIVFTILILLVSIAMTSWWIADLVIFATNQRLSGNGCVLTPI